MIKIRRALTGAFVALLAVLAVAGCTVADPDTSQKVLHYSGGAFSSQNFQYCTDPGVRTTGGAGDWDFYYPNGRRTFAFVGGDGSDSEPITVSTKDQQQLISRGTVAFRLNTDCAPYKDAQGVFWPGGRLQKFHDTIGRQVLAYTEDTGGQPTPEGWKNMLRTYLGQSLDRAMDQAGLKFGWQQLSNEPAAQNAWQADIEAALPKLLNEQMGDDLIIVENVQPGRPDVPDALRTELANNQAAALRQRTSETDQEAAKNFPGGINAYLAYLQQQAVNKAIAEGRVNPLIVPQGAPIIAGGR